MFLGARTAPGSVEAAIGKTDQILALAAFTCHQGRETINVCHNAE